MPDERKAVMLPKALFQDAEEYHEALGIRDARDTLIIAATVGMLSLLMCRYARENGIDDPVIELRVRAGTHRSAAIVGVPQTLVLSELYRQS